MRTSSAAAATPDMRCQRCVSEDGRVTSALCAAHRVDSGRVGEWSSHGLTATWNPFVVP